VPREQTLLERIAAREEGGGRRQEARATEDLDALMDSVRVHLARLLNARQGMSEAQPDYGLPALSDLTIGVGDYVKKVRDSIQTAIEKYEPRLRRARVTLVTDEDQERMLAFRVDAVLVSRTGEHRVWYETSLAGDGQFDVTA
jgi:type VI secretion system protein